MINAVTLNGGDAAILHGVRGMLQSVFEQDVRLVVFDAQAEVASRYYPEIEFRQMYAPGNWLPPRLSRVARRLKIAGSLTVLERAAWLLGGWLVTDGGGPVGRAMLTRAAQEHFRAYQGSVLIVSTGGTYLVEQYEINHRIDHLRLAVWTGKPVAMLSQSLGPFHLTRNRRRLRKILPAMSSIMLRDERSRGHIEDLGLRLPQVHLAADAAFALADEERVRALEEKPRNDPIQVAISVRDWPYFRNSPRAQGMERYRSAIAATVHHLIKQFSAKVTFISTCQGIPEYWTDDSRLAQQIVGSLPPDFQAEVNVDSDFHRPAQLLNILSWFDLVLATRMHMGILALAAGTPVFPISYEFKTAELFRNLGLGGWVENIETLNAASLPLRVERFIQQFPGIAPMLVKLILEQRSSALASAAILRDVLQADRNGAE